MKPPAYPPPMRQHAAGIAFLLAAVGLAGCGLQAWPDREPARAKDIRVDSLIFLPRGTRFALLDSATPIAFVKYHAGYACSEILEMRLDTLPSGSPPAFGPVTDVRLPTTPDCAVDTAGRDTALTRVFTRADLARLQDPLADIDDRLRLANSSGWITDSVRLVRGMFVTDSMIGKPDQLGNLFTSGHYTYQDTSGANPHLLFLDSTSDCVSLDRAEYARMGDSIKVRFRLVTLDSAASPDSCRSLGLTDSVFARPAPVPTP